MKDCGWADTNHDCPVQAVNLSKASVMLDLKTEDGLKHLKASPNEHAATTMLPECHHISTRMTVMAIACNLLCPAPLHYTAMSAPYG